MNSSGSLASLLLFSVLKSPALSQSFILREFIYVEEDALKQGKKFRVMGYRQAGNHRKHGDSCVAESALSVLRRGTSVQQVSLISHPSGSVFPSIDFGYQQDSNKYLWTTPSSIIPSPKDFSAHCSHLLCVSFQLPSVLVGSPLSPWLQCNPDFSLSLFLASLHSHHEQSFSFMPCPARHCSCVARQCANRDRSTQVQKTCRRSSKTGTSPPFLPLTKPRRQIRCSES